MKVLTYPLPWQNQLTKGFVSSSRVDPVSLRCPHPLSPTVPWLPRNSASLLIGSGLGIESSTLHAQSALQQIRYKRWWWWWWLDAKIIFFPKFLWIWMNSTSLLIGSELQIESSSLQVQVLCNVHTSKGGWGWGWG